jgi:hypothetical protein
LLAAAAQAGPLAGRTHLAVLAADYLVVTTVVILGKTVTVWHQAAALYRLATTGEYPMVQAAQAPLLSAIIPRSFRLGI